MLRSSNETRHGRFAEFMHESTKNPAKKQASSTRKDRLSEQLRANLAKRKAQTRARRTGEADQRPEGIQPVKPAPE